MNAQVLVIVVVVAVSILLTAIVFGLVAIIRKSISPFIRILAVTATALSLLLSPGVVDTAVMQSARSAAITYTQGAGLHRLPTTFRLSVIRSCYVFLPDAGAATRLPQRARCSVT